MNYVMRLTKIHRVKGLAGLVFVLTTAPGFAGVHPYPDAKFARGVVYSSWDGTYRNIARWTADLAHFKNIGVNWIQIMTFARQPSVNGPRIHVDARRATPDAFVRAARKAGFKILLKPHVWSPQFYDGSRRWRGSIVMANDRDWQLWFKEYTSFMLGQARFAQKMGIEMLSVGLEYVEASKRTSEWRTVIRAIREVYDGQLTYAADGNHESDHIEFWNDLDVIGMNGYFALDAPDRTTVGRLLMAWLSKALKLASLSAQYDRPILFTEAGYPSVLGSIRAPWQWPSGTEEVDLEGQAVAYEAYLKPSRLRHGFAAFWWKYYERPEGKIPISHDYTPRNKSAEDVLKKWYLRAPSGTRPKVPDPIGLNDAR